MADGLPEGLVIHSQGITAEIDRIDRVEPEDIAQLWKVYSVNKTVIADGVGRRLENLFWRIWSSRKLLNRISGRQVARQFQQILEGGYFRTTPTQSPRISRSLGSNETSISTDGRAPASPRESSPSVDPPPVATSEGQDEKRERDSLVPQAGSVSSRTKETVAPLPSILKKPKVAFVTQHSKTAKALFPDNGLPGKTGNDDDDDGRGVPLSTYAPCAEVVNNEGASSPQARHQSSAEENTGFIAEDERGPRRRARDREEAMTTEKSLGSQDIKPKSTGKRTVQVKTGASKRRPITPQRKSSQSSSSATSQRTASPITGTKFGSVASIHALDVNLENPPHDQDQPVMQRSRHGSPHPSQRRGGAMEDRPFSDESREKPPNETKGIEDGLVDRDFRSRFAIRSRADGHLFAPFPGKSTAAAATSVADQAIGTTGSTQNANDQWSEHFTDEIVRLKPPGPSGPRARDDSETQPLPRTKSQLTLLLERDRQRSQDGNHGTEPR